jgi:subfamily B ATP-binding cassette protein MsbA
MKTFWRLLSYSKPYSGFLPEYIVQALLAVMFGVFNFSLLIPLLNVLFGTVQMPEKLVMPEAELSVKYVVALFNYQMYSLIQTKGLEYALFFICGIIFVFIFLIIAFLLGVTQLMSLQGPVFYQEKSPHWGKVEEQE